MIYNDASYEIIENAKKSIDNINGDQVVEMLEILQKVENVFVLGVGRSGLVAKAFAMRLMHLGLNVYVVGETITPAIKKEDCLLAISGSGETSYIISTTGIAHNIGATIISITSYVDSTLANRSDLVIELKGRTKIDDEPNYIRRQISGQHQTLTPLGTIFEVSTLIFLDSTISQLMDVMSQTEKDLKARHTVLE